MVIKRNVNGIECEFELTKEELNKAYYEAMFLCDMENCRDVCLDCVGYTQFNLSEAQVETCVRGARKNINYSDEWFDIDYEEFRESLMTEFENASKKEVE